MANKLYEETDIQAIATAIRAKGVSGQMTVSQMASKIADIQTGTTPTGTKNITANGTHDVADYENANVQVPVGSLKSKAFEVTLTSSAINGQIAVAEDPDVKAHYADAKFMIAVSKISGTDYYRSINHSIVCNTPYNANYGIADFYATSKSYSYVTSDAKTAGMNSVYADSDGNLRWNSSNVSASSGRPWNKGTYLIVVCWGGD